jgi:hypothetical protein
MLILNDQNRRCLAIIDPCENHAVITSESGNLGVVR